MTNLTHFDWPSGDIDWDLGVCFSSRSQIVSIWGG